MLPLNFCFLKIKHYFIIQTRFCSNYVFALNQLYDIHEVFIHKKKVSLQHPKVLQDHYFAVGRSKK